MHRRALGVDRGMVFLFARPTGRGFWMKDTLIPLSIAFWSGAHRIIAIMDMTPCRTIPCPLYKPNHLYLGALEVNRGFFWRHGVRIEDRIDLVPARATARAS